MELNPHTYYKFTTLSLLVSMFASLASPETRGSEENAAAAEFFETKIRPVLAEQCYDCHSEQSEKLRANLRVDTRTGLLQGGNSGAAIVPGNPKQSLLLSAIQHVDKDLAMPLERPKLPEPVIANFRTWIQQGAFWPGQQEDGASTKTAGIDIEERRKQRPWTWTPPSQQDLPSIRYSQWPREDLDYFILAKLEQNDLAPSPPTDNRTWLRRVHFALTGLPPSPVAIREFLKDTSPQARTKVVDQLLASPHYGERWARHWMDLMRYAESRGHEGDYTIANAYHYRDYLIRAFNADLPYRQFLLEHIAGDLLPSPRINSATGSEESVLATGWAFLGEEVHSPVDIRQDECDRIDNKIDVFTKSFLGLTLSCARCHDHKFDPITTSDYYGFTGFMLSSSYQQVRFESRQHNRKLAAQLAIARQQAKPAIVQALVNARSPGIVQTADYLIAAATTATTPQPATPPTENSPSNNSTKISLNPARIQQWRNELHQATNNPHHPLHLFGRLAHQPAVDRKSVIDTLTEATTLPQDIDLPDDARIVADYSNPSHQPWKTDGPGFGLHPLRIGEICLSEGSDPSTPVRKIMPYGAACRDLFWNRLTTPPGNQNDTGNLGATSRSGQMLRTPTITLKSGKLHYLIKGRTKVYAAVDSHIMIAGPLHGRLVQKFNSGASAEPVWVTHNLSLYSGHRTHLEFGPDGDGEFELLMVVEAPTKPKYSPVNQPLSPPPAKATSQQDFARFIQEQLKIAWNHFAQGTIAHAPNPAKQARLANWLIQKEALFSEKPTSQTTALTKNFFAERDAIAQRVKWQSKTAVAWFDGTGVDEHVLMRGNPKLTGPVATRGLPSVLSDGTPIQPASSSGRYELGRQLVSPDNPLVARVLVNRVWHHLFGRGIVATVDNFGHLGEPPTHPELLDHLTWQFTQVDNWSIKRLLRRLVLSSTYAMSSKATNVHAEELDPSNRLLHRMPVRRLESEAIRDALLAVSGNLNPQLYGPSIPVHLTEFVIGRGRPNKSGPLDGNGRRSIYTAVRRNFLPTMMLAFDTPIPFSTVGRRNVTNVPGQALVLMNDALFHQQSRLWAERMLYELPTTDPQRRIEWLFETAYGRPSLPEETAACLDNLVQLRTVQEKDPQDIEVWSQFCHALLNANDFIYLK